MLKKQVTQYICEHCGKKNYSASHMTKHEKHCTRNPDRVCGMCGRKGIVKVKIKDYIFYNNVAFDQIDTDKLADFLDRCPACTLATWRDMVRQIKDENIFYHCDSEFYKKLKNKWWAEHNFRSSYDYED
jgi:DNA-directed RNA polymerase subunit RPC12/RpoP